jgi:hypothetical protein
MISFLSSSLCDDAKVRPIGPGRFLSHNERGQNTNTGSHPLTVPPFPFDRRLLRRRAINASDDLLSVLTLDEPDTQYSVRPKAVESSSGERFHLRNGPWWAPGQSTTRSRQVRNQRSRVGLVRQDSLFKALVQPRQGSHRFPDSATTPPTACAPGRRCQLCAFAYHHGQSCRGTTYSARYPVDSAANTRQSR